MHISDLVLIEEGLYVVKSWRLEMNMVMLELNVMIHLMNVKGKGRLMEMLMTEQL